MLPRFLPRFLLPLLCTLPLAAQEPQPTPEPMPMLVRNWNTREGLPQDHVRAMVHSRDGFLWLATDGGRTRQRATQVPALLPQW